MAKKKEEPQNVDVEKTEYEDAMKNVAEEDYDGEPFDAEVLDDFPGTSLTAGMEVSAQPLQNGDYVIDGAICVKPEVFQEWFTPIYDIHDEEDDCESLPAEPVSSEGDAPDIPEGLSPSELFEHLLMQTGREGIENLIDWCRESDLYVSPASTRYHGSYAGGLVDHCLNVYDNLYNLVNFTKQLYPNTDWVSKKSMILVALLHDLCKVNTYVPGTRNVKNEETGQWEKVDIFKREPLLAMGHAGKSIFIIQQFIQLTPQEAQAIYWHMGGFDISNYNTLNEMGQAFKENFLAFMLHQADMMSTYVTENEYYSED